MEHKPCPPKGGFWRLAGSGHKSLPRLDLRPTPNANSVPNPAPANPVPNQWKKVFSFFSEQSVDKPRMSVIIKAHDTEKKNENG